MLNLRCHLGIYTPVRIDTSIHFACKAFHSPPSSPNLMPENSCSVSTKQAGISIITLTPTQHTTHSLTSLTVIYPCKRTIAGSRAVARRRRMTGFCSLQPHLTLNCSRQKEETEFRLDLVFLVSKSVNKCVHVVEKLCFWARNRCSPARDSGV